MYVTAVTGNNDNLGTVFISYHIYWELSEVVFHDKSQKISF